MQWEGHVASEFGHFEVCCALTVKPLSLNRFIVP